MFDEDVLLESPEVDYVCECPTCGSKNIGEFGLLGVTVYCADCNWMADDEFGRIRKGGS